MTKERRLEIERSHGQTLQAVYLPGEGPGIVWLGGFMSDMAGTKALHLRDWAEARGRAFMRFDYYGHGETGGDMRTARMSWFRDDALAAMERVETQDLILVGSSMGGWAALLAALAAPERVKALALIAPAPDFTERLIWPQLSEAQRQEMLTRGWIERPSLYGADPYIYARSLIEDGREHLLLGQPIPLSVPIWIVHGMEDPDVPYGLSLELVDKLQSRDVELCLVKEGDHRLSGPEDLARLGRALEGLLARASG